MKIPRQLPSIFRLKLGCKTPAQGKALYDKGLAVQRQGETEYARRIFHAVIRSKCAQKAQRMYAAHRLALIYVNRNHCKAARTVWTIYQKLAKSRQPLPGCY